MEICLRRKEVISTLETAQNKDLNLDDFDLADSDREDYHNNVDILFVLDTTGSMGSYISQAMVTIKKIVEKFSKMEFNIKFALCTYRDHPPQDSTYVTEFTDLTSGKKLIQVLTKVTAAGGGDGPEAVMDGLREGLSKSQWRLGEDGTTQSKRFLFHICDAPPHGDEFGGHSSDPEWKKNGCPCGTKKEDINNLLKQNKVDYHLIKAVSDVNKMEQVFKQCFGENFAETIVLDSSAQNQGSCYEEESECLGSAKKCEDDDDCEEECEDITHIESLKEVENCLSELECETLKSCKKVKYSKKSASASSKSKKDMWMGVLDVLDKKLA